MTWQFKKRQLLSNRRTMVIFVKQVVQWLSNRRLVEHEHVEVEDAQEHLQLHLVGKCRHLLDGLGCTFSLFIGNLASWKQMTTACRWPYCSKVDPADTKLLLKFGATPAGDIL